MYETQKSYSRDAMVRYKKTDFIGYLDRMDMS